MPAPITQVVGSALISGSLGGPGFAIYGRR